MYTRTQNYIGIIKLIASLVRKKLQTMKQILKNTNRKTGMLNIPTYALHFKKTFSIYEEMK